MIGWLSVALGAPWLVGVETGAADLDRDGDGRVDGTDAAYVCYRSSRVCVVDGHVPREALLGLDGLRHVERDRPMQVQQGTVLTDCPATDAVDEVGYELTRIGVLSGAHGGAWDVGKGAGATVAVQDAGFRTSHVELDGRVVRGWDYGDNDGRPEVSPAAVPEHGTFVAGIVSAVEDGSGRVGVAPEAELFLQKIADSTGALYFSYAIAAMDDLVLTAPEVKVVDYSIAATDPPRAFEDAVAGLATADILLVTAAANCTVPSCGNADNDVDPIFPASYSLVMDHVVAVSSQRPDGTLDPYSHYGLTSVALGAPGADVCSLAVTSDTAFSRASGTSYAAPVVAGVAALARQAFPRLTAGQTEQLLCATANAAELVGQVRCGSVDADRALHAAWLDEVSGEGIDDVVDMEVGVERTVELTVENLAGEEEVVVAVEAAGILTEPSTVVLAADGPTTVSLSVFTGIEGSFEGNVTVTGCCSSVSAPWSAEATGEPAGTDTGTPTDTGAPTDTDTDDPTTDPATEEPAPSAEEEEKGGCGCTQGSRWSLSPWLARRRVPRGR